MTDLITIRGTDGEAHRIPVAAMDAIIKRQRHSQQLELEAERERIANMALEAILQAPHHKIWWLERIMEACGAPVDKWREQHEWEEGVAP